MSCCVNKTVPSASQTCYVAKVRLELLIIWLPHPEYWEYKPAPLNLFVESNLGLCAFQANILPTELPLLASTNFFLSTPLSSPELSVGIACV